MVSLGITTFHRFRTVCIRWDHQCVMPWRPDFDVILGMDLLSANHTSIYCSHKEVVSNLYVKASFKYKGIGIVVLLKVISAVKASKLLNQGT